MPTGWQILPQTFTTKTARELGVHYRDLYGWRDDGHLTQLSRGVFRRSDAPPATFPDLLAVSYRAPNAIVCCLSAAAVHGLTDELSIAVQIAVPNGDHPPSVDHPPTAVFRFDRTTFELGVSSVEAAPHEPVRIYDSARTVVDLMRLRHRLGEPVAYLALRRYLAGSRPRPTELLDYARELGSSGPVRSALDIVLAE